MSFILGRYASRGDLSTFDKVHFSLTTRIEESARMRAFYRALYRDAPAWAHLTLLLLGILGAIPLMIATIPCMIFSASIEDTWGENVLEAFDQLPGFIVFMALFLGTFIFEIAIAIQRSPWFWLLIPACACSFLAFWFGLLMNDYDMELDRVEKKGRYA
jgi:hypothetical protein